MNAENVIDRLTGLFQKSVFTHRFQDAIDRVDEYQGVVTLAFIDIDEFLHVNTDHGHEVGDAVLQRIAEIIHTIAGPGAMAFRHGGDEFAILFESRDRETTFLTLELIRREVENTKTYGRGEQMTELSLTISGGMAAYPVDGSTQKEVLRKADQALYSAKKAGRNRIKLAYEERMATKTSHYTLTQLERLTKLSKRQVVGEAVLLREALDDLLFKYGVTTIET